jgi:hypothetical protein
MVVKSILGLGLALPTGALFGIGYGTGVRIGYEQIYPLLFPAKEIESSPDPQFVRRAVKQMYTYHDAVGGKEAVQMGIAQGIKMAKDESDTNPDFQHLLELESFASGNTQANLRPGKASRETGRLELQDSETPATTLTGADLPHNFAKLPFEEGMTREDINKLTRIELLQMQGSYLFKSNPYFKERLTFLQKNNLRSLEDIQKHEAEQRRGKSTPSKEVEEMAVYLRKNVEFLTAIKKSKDDIAYYEGKARTATRSAVASWNRRANVERNKYNAMKAQFYQHARSHSSSRNALIRKQALADMRRRGL